MSETLISADIIAQITPGHSMFTILYVEDDYLNIALVRKMLKTMDYRVVDVRSGLNATGAALHERPDAILLDIHLADMSGLEVARELKSHPMLAHIPVIALTADPSNYRECHEAGCDGYLNKPMSRGGLLKTILQFM